LGEGLGVRVFSPRPIVLSLTLPLRGRESISPLPLGEGLGVRAVPLALWERGWG